MRDAVRASPYVPIAALLCVAVAASLWGLRARSACPGSGAHDEVVLSDGGSPCSTADKEQRRLIRGLLKASRRAEEPAGLTIDYPEDGSVFPPDMIAPVFLWHDDSSGADRWLAEITLGAGSSRVRVLVPGVDPPRGEIDPEALSITNEVYEPTPYQASAKAWRPGTEVWDAIKRGSVAGVASVTLLGYRADDPERVLSRGRVTLRTASEPVGAPIFYRDVPLMPSATQDGVIKPLDQKAQPLIAWRLRDVSLPKSRVMLREMPTCANCHSFSADGRTLGMDIDGPQGDKGAYAIAPVERKTVIEDEQIITWNAFEDKPRGFNTLGFMSRVSPDGRHVVSTVNEALYVRNFWDYRFSQVFFPTRGILAWYSRATGEIKALPGADDPAYVHCNPVWTPDGKTIIFARAKARDPYDRGRPTATYSGDPNETQIRYDLYRMPFNNGRGGRPEPVPGASNNGMSNSFPKVSPDGKWLVWVQSKNGLLMRPDGKLWIVPVAGGEPRMMRCNGEPMNSWHSFSPNGRWMVFSSKRNRPYTQMFLTYIDEQGDDSPGVLIENSTPANRAVNLPEFVNVGYDEFAGISVPAVDHYEHYHRGNQLAKEGRYREAVEEFEKALQGEHEDWRINDWRIHDSLSKILLRVDQNDLALEHIRESLALNPYNAETHANLGYVLSERREYDEALFHLDAAVRLARKDPKAYYNRGTVRMNVGDTTGAMDDYSEAIRINPRYADAYTGRGKLHKDLGDLPSALSDFDSAIRLNPNNPTSKYFRAVIRREAGDLAGALEDLEQALVVAPPNWPHIPEVRALRDQVRTAVGGGG